MLLLCVLFYNFASRKKIIDKLKTNCYEIKNGNMV